MDAGMDIQPTEPNDEAAAELPGDDAGVHPSLQPERVGDEPRPETPSISTDLTEFRQPPEESYYSLDPQFIRAEQCSSLLLASILLAGAVIWMAIRWWVHGFDLFLYVLAGASATIVMVTTWFAIFWPIKTFRRTRWQVGDAGLEIQKGVVWRHQMVVPLSRVQHADVSQGPIQRLFGLGSLTVHTAGTSNASVELSGLNHDIAVQVRDAIVRARSRENAS
jgi:membrane protein YdbS with pleckstrin-like domain